MTGKTENENLFTGAVKYPGGENAHAQGFVQNSVNNYLKINDYMK